MSLLSPRVSIALATYNGARHLPEQLASLAAQRTKPLELVVSDDGSTDDTLDIVRDFATHAPFPVSVARNASTLGYADNFLAAAKRCQGSLVAFCDQDDVWHPDKLSRCTEAMAAPGVRLSVHAAELVDAALAPLGTLNLAPPAGAEGPSPWGLQPGFKPLGFSLVVDAALIREFAVIPRFTDPYSRRGRMAHDTWIYFIASLLGRVVWIPVPLVRYRQHGHNTCGFNSLSLAQRLTMTFGADAKEYRGRGILTRSYAANLQRLAIVLPHHADRLLAGSAFYVAQSQCHLLRARLYELETDRSARWQALGELADARAYRARDTGGLGVSSFAKDALRAFAGPALPRVFEALDPARTLMRKGISG